MIHPEEDRQVGRNIGVLQKRVSSSFVFSILFYEETINTYWMLVKDIRVGVEWNDLFNLRSKTLFMY